MVRIQTDTTFSGMKKKKKKKQTTSNEEMNHLFLSGEKIYANSICTQRELQDSSLQVIEGDRVVRTRALISFEFFPRSLVTTTFGGEAEAETTKYEGEGR